MTQEHIGTKSMAEARAGVKTLAEVMYERALDAFGKDRIDEAYDPVKQANGAVYVMW